MAAVYRCGWSGDHRRASGIETVTSTSDRPPAGHRQRRAPFHAGGDGHPHLARVVLRLAVLHGHHERRRSPLDVGTHVHAIDRRPVGGAQFHVPVDAAPVADVVQHAGRPDGLLLAWALQRDGARVGDAQRDHVVAARADGVGDVERKRRTESVVLADALPVDEQRRLAMGAADAQRHRLAAPGRGNGHGAPVPRSARIVVPQRALWLTDTLRLPGSRHDERPIEGRRTLRPAARRCPDPAGRAGTPTCR